MIVKLILMNKHLKLVKNRQKRWPKRRNTKKDMKFQVSTSVQAQVSNHNRFHSIKSNS